MKKLFVLSIILSLTLTSCAFAQEVISDYGNNTISVLNEELRKLKYATDKIVILDEKVKASSTDPTAGYLEAKIDNSTIYIVNNKLKVNATVVTANVTHPTIAYNDTYNTTGFDLGTKAETVFIQVVKNVTSGNTVFVSATGSINNNALSINYFRLYWNTTLMQRVYADTTLNSIADVSWGLGSVVTGLSGNTTFNVTANLTGISVNTDVFGVLNVMEF